MEGVRSDTRREIAEKSVFTREERGVDRGSQINSYYTDPHRNLLERPENRKFPLIQDGGHHDLRAQINHFRWAILFGIQPELDETSSLYEALHFDDERKPIADVIKATNIPRP